MFFVTFHMKIDLTYSQHLQIEVFGC